MIKVTVGNNLNKNDVIVDESTTLRQAIEQSGVDCFGKKLQLNGVNVDNLDQPFSTFGVSGHVWLLAVAKLENA